MLQNDPVWTPFLLFLILGLAIQLRWGNRTFSTKFLHSFSMLNPFSSDLSLFQVCYFVIQNPRSRLVVLDPFGINGCYIWSQTWPKPYKIVRCYCCILKGICVKKLHYYPFLAKYYSYAIFFSSDGCITMLHNYPQILMTNQSLPGVLWQKICFWQFLKCHSTCLF